MSHGSHSVRDTQHGLLVCGTHLRDRVKNIPMVSRVGGGKINSLSTFLHRFLLVGIIHVLFITTAFPTAGSVETSHDARTDSYFRRFDQDDDGVISLAEFISGMEDEEDTPQDTKDTVTFFNTFERNQDGVMDRTEFEGALFGDAPPNTISQEPTSTSRSRYPTPSFSPLILACRLSERRGLVRTAG